MNLEPRGSYTSAGSPQWVGQHMMKHLHQADAETARKAEGKDGTKVSGGGD